MVNRAVVAVAGGVGFIPGVIEGFQTEGAGAAVHRDLDAGIVLWIEAFIEADWRPRTVGEQNTHAAGRLTAIVEASTRFSGVRWGGAIHHNVVGAFLNL